MMRFAVDEYPGNFQLMLHLESQTGLDLEAFGKATKRIHID